MNCAERNLSVNILKEPNPMKYLVQQPLTSCLKQSENRYAATQCDVQYHICSTFFKHSGMEMMQKQLEAMQASQILLQKLQQKISRNGKKQQSVELSQTKDGTFFNQEESVLDLDQQSHQPLKRVLSRTRLNKNTTRRVVSYFSIAMKEVEQFCSPKTFNFINSIVEEHKKLTQGQCEQQKKDTALKRTNNRLSQIQQQNLILKNRNQQIEATIKRLQQQLLSLKKFKKENSLARVSSASSLFNNQKNSKCYNPFNANQKTIQISENFLKQKQILLRQKQQKLKEIDQKIINLLSCDSNMDKCQRCCSMIKKLKEAILKYKTYMQIQLDSTQKLYQKFKLAFVV